MRLRSRQHGFTLLELMVALAILAIGIVALLQAVSQGVAATARLRDATTAMALAQMKMEELASNVKDVPAQSNGDFGDIGPGFGWRAVAANTDVEGLKQIAVTVFWQRGRREHTVSLETCVSENMQVTPLEDMESGTTTPTTTNQP